MPLKISPGHWHKENSGANGIIIEVREARRVVARVSQLLTQMKFTHSVIQDNTSKNQNENLVWLATQHNKEDGENYLVHFNAATATKDDRGVEAYHYGSAGDKEKAQAICDAISKVSGLKNRGAKEKKDLYVIKNTKNRCILIEVCFVDSEADVKKYQNNFESICIAIAESVSGRKYTKPETPKEPTITVVPSVKYQVIAGTYENPSNADKQVDALKKLGIAAFVQVKK